MMIDEVMNYLSGSMSKVKRILRDKSYIIWNYVSTCFYVFIRYSFNKISQTLSI